MKGYGIEIKNDLLDPKHIKQMGGSVWLYMWLVDKMTSVNEDGTGKVLGGKPIKYEEIKKELGISKNTYTRWMDKLLEYPYIEATRTPYGIVFRVKKAYKNFGKRIPINRESNSPQIGNLTPENGESNKTLAVRHNSKTSSKEEQAKPVYGNQDINLLLEALTKDGRMMDGSVRENRRYAKLLLDKVKKVVGGDMVRARDGCLFIINAARGSPFHSKNATSMKYLFYNAGKIIEENKSKKNIIGIAI